MEERVYRPRWHCRLRLWHRWQTYEADNGEPYRPRAGPGRVPSESLYQECLDCGTYRDVSPWDFGSGEYA